VLARAVAYERQIREHGDLPARVVSTLAAVSREDLGPPAAPIAGSKARGPAGAPSIRPGTTFVREHQNSLHDARSRGSRESALKMSSSAAIRVGPRTRLSCRS
jgi:hypothetical protein